MSFAKPQHDISLDNNATNNNNIIAQQQPLQHQQQYAPSSHEKKSIQTKNTPTLHHESDIDHDRFSKLRGRPPTENSREEVLAMADKTSADVDAQQKFNNKNAAPMAMNAADINMRERRDSATISKKPSASTPSSTRSSSYGVADTPEKRREQALMEKVNKAREMNERWEHKVEDIKHEEERRHADIMKYVETHRDEFKNEFEEAAKRKEQFLEERAQHAREMNLEWEEKVEEIKEDEARFDDQIRQYSREHAKEILNEQDQAAKRKEAILEEKVERVREKNMEWEEKVEEIKEDEARYEAQLRRAATSAAISSARKHRPSIHDEHYEEREQHINSSSAASTPSKTVSRLRENISRSRENSIHRTNRGASDEEARHHDNTTNSLDNRPPFDNSTFNHSAYKSEAKNAAEVVTTPDLDREKHFLSENGIKLKDNNNTNKNEQKNEKAAAEDSKKSLKGDKNDLKKDEKDHAESKTEQQKKSSSAKPAHEQKSGLDLIREERATMLKIPASGSGARSEAQNAAEVDGSTDLKREKAHLKMAPIDEKLTEVRRVPFDYESKDKDKNKKEHQQEKTSQQAKDADNTSKKAEEINQHNQQQQKSSAPAAFGERPQQHQQQRHNDEDLSRYNQPVGNNDIISRNSGGTMKNEAANAGEPVKVPDLDREKAFLKDNGQKGSAGEVIHNVSSQKSYGGDENFSTKNQTTASLKPSTFEHRDEKDPLPPRQQLSANNDIISRNSGGYMKNEAANAGEAVKVPDLDHEKAFLKNNGQKGSAGEELSSKPRS